MSSSTNSTPRIASLVPSLTELLFALGLGPWVVARTGFCIHPAGVLGTVPKVGGTKDVNLAKLRRLAPTHVLVNVDENRLEDLPALRKIAPRVVVTHPCTPRDNLVLLDQMEAEFGALPHVPARADALRQELRDELARSAATDWPPCEVLYLIWKSPWMTVARDTYISRMLATVGWHTVPAVEGGETGAARYPVLRGDEAFLAGVQRVLLSSEPFAFGPSHAAAAQALCPGARVQLVDGELLSWYGPRAAAGLRCLRGLAAC